MSAEDFHTAPSDAIFKEIHDRAVEIWQTYDDEFGYATEKIATIDALGNVGGNYMYIVQLFDDHNQLKLMAMLNEDARAVIRKAMEW